MSDRTRFLLIIWLAVCSFMIFTIVLLGGAVRLTGSGLSMVDWKPIMGTIPPLSAESWLQVFSQYQLFPEYQLINHKMTLSEFKFIYLMEFAHRLLGRLIGLTYFIPFLWFLCKQRIPNELKLHLWALLLLGGLQGLIGWYMVKSGLVDDPKVSQYRLTLHLMVAVLIYGYMLRVIIGLNSGFNTQLRRHVKSAKSRASLFGYLIIGMILLMIATGGFVAGTHAGFIFNTFPKMAGQWLPGQILSMSPIWINFFENPITIQFVHRVLALLVLIFIIRFALRLIYSENSERNKPAAIFLILAVILQVFIGIVTLLSKVPLYLGMAHQAGALLLLSAAIFAVFRGKSFSSEKYAIDKV